MPLDVATYFGLLDLTNPRGTDSRSLSDDFQRVMRESCKIQFPNLTDEVIANHEDLNATFEIGEAGYRCLYGQATVTTVFFYNTTVPEGYDLNDLDGGIYTLIVGEELEGGVYGGTQDPKSYSLSVSVTGTGSTDTDGAHSHSGTSTVENLGDVKVVDIGTNPDSVARYQHTHDVTVGPDGTHSHGVTGLSSTGSTEAYTPRYAQGVFGRLLADINP